MEIHLTQGKVAIIDDADYPLIKDYRWFAHHQKDQICWYARSTVKDESGKWIVVLMHRLLMNAPADMQVDHRNRDGLDNRRNNLRLATRRQNKANSLVYKSSASGLKGVRCVRGTRWRAVGQQKGSPLKHLGYFSSAEEAALAWDVWARETHGEFARCNYPLPTWHLLQLK